MKGRYIATMVIVMAIAGTVLIQADARGETAGKTDTLAKGKRLFVKHCAGCHGPDGKGDGYKLL